MTVSHPKFGRTEFSTIALAEFEAECRFRAMAAKGNPAIGLRLLEKLDALTN